MGKLKVYLRKLHDPRAANASYPLVEVLFVALAAVLRRLALNFLRAHPEPISMRRKMNAAAWDDTFLVTLLSQKR